MPKQVQIAAIDERHSGFDEGDHGITQGRGLPGFGIDTRRAIDCDGDFAIGRAIHAAICGAEFEAKATALLDSHARVAQRWTLEPGAGEACQCIDTIKDVVIDGNDHRKLIVWGCAGKKENLEVMVGKTGI